MSLGVSLTVLGGDATLLIHWYPPGFSYNMDIIDYATLSMIPWL